MQGTELIVIVLAVLVVAAVLWLLLRPRKPAASEPITGTHEDLATITPVMAAPPVAPAPPPLGPEPENLAAPAHDPVTAAEQIDDLTQLKGLGPRVAARLSELGVTRFQQLADLNPEEAAALDAQLGNFSGRLFRDRWIDQARYLAAGDRTGYEAEFGKL